MERKSQKEKQIYSSHGKAIPFEASKRILSSFYSSIIEFEREYRKTHCGKKKAEEFYILLLNELANAVTMGDIVMLKKLNSLTGYVSNIENHNILRQFYNNPRNPLKITNLIILACKYNRVKVLAFLFSKDSKILTNLSVGIGRTALLSDNEDEVGHNAFYYAIRSSNIELLDVLINNWPENHFSINTEELDKILSAAFEELKLKNVLLSDEITFFIEKKLINLRFFSRISGQINIVGGDLIKITERIELLLQNIVLLNTEYSNREVDERFLFIAKFIAKNIYVLKRLLKSTYDRYPWEEIEFCLISFISSQTTFEEINVFCLVILDKSKILSYLLNFADKLRNDKDLIKGLNVGKLAELPTLKREEVVRTITSNDPQFVELYNDYKEIRDIYSLWKMRDFITVGSSADANQREDQLVIMRVLQVVGEYLKNTLESPKFSNSTTDLLLSLFPKNTIKVIINLRNSLSHACSLSKRIELEENGDISFFIGVQRDIKNVGDVLTNILFNKKINIIRTLLEKIINGNLDEIKKVTRHFNYFEFDKITSQAFIMMKHETLENLVEELSIIIGDKTFYEKLLFLRINEIFRTKNIKMMNSKTDYLAGFISLNTIKHVLANQKIDQNTFRVIKKCANSIIKNIFPQIETEDSKEITRLISKVMDSIISRNHDTIVDIHLICWKILHVIEFEVGTKNWIEELKIHLCSKKSFVTDNQHEKSSNYTEVKCNKYLLRKLTELKNLLKNNNLSGQEFEMFLAFKENKKMQMALEMLMLDIMSILENSKEHLENNLFFLEDNLPVLNGKCLRNHIAHDNTLLNILSCSSLIALLINAKKLIEIDVIDNKEKIGKFVCDDPIKLIDKYNVDIGIISNQAKMFIALEEGNIESLKNCLDKGADLNGRSFNLWTAVHFCANGSSLEVMKFILDQNLNFDVKDINSQSPLHVAAAHGKKAIIEYLIKKANLSVNDLNNEGKTPLYLAALNGHKDAVEILLKYNSNLNIQDKLGWTPLHCAILNYHFDVAKILLKLYMHVNKNVIIGGFIPLHTAAEIGFLELVNYLLRNGANVNARNDKDTIPLHIAALTGHLEVVKALILNGADVNARVIDGRSSLHYAIENGHIEVTNLLLRHAADVDVIDKTYRNTPLHYAANDGHEDIVNSLLEYKAKANVSTVAGTTPLHLASQSGHFNIASALITHGVNINVKDKNNGTPLHYAAENGCKNVVLLLIKNCAELDGEMVNGCTPVHLAAMSGQKDVIDILIKNKAGVNVKDIHGNTALHLSVLNGSKDVVEVILKSNVDCNEQNGEGDTPLHLAAVNGSKDIVDLLIKNKAKVSIRNCMGRTPVHLAALHGNEVVVDLLIKNAAKINVYDNFGFMPLHGAISGGLKGVIELLINYKALVNSNAKGSSSPLLVAVEANQEKIVEVLVTCGVDMNEKNENNLTPLCSAVKKNFLEIVKILIANGANVNEETNMPLMLAVAAGYKDIVEILLLNKASVNCKVLENMTPLHLAALMGFKDIVKALLFRGADANAIATSNDTPLHRAAYNGHKEITEILITNGAAVNAMNSEGITPLHVAAINNHCNVVKVLLNNSADINIRDYKTRTCLELAVSHGHFEVVKILLKLTHANFIAKESDGWTLLHIASQSKHLEIVKYLVKEGSNIHAKNICGLKAIHLAALEGRKPILEFFISKNMCINDPGPGNQTLLHYTAIHGHLDIVKYLITKDANINARNFNGATPLHIAAQYGNKDVVEVLLNNGAIYNACDNFHRMPADEIHDESIISIFVSIETMFQAIKLFCLSKFENIIKGKEFICNACSENYGTPLHSAIYEGNVEIVNSLLDNKADPNLCHYKGFTPLHLAAKFSNAKIATALLSYGAIYNAISESGKTPLDLAVEICIINLLKLVTESFKNVKNGNTKVINNISMIKDLEILKAVMCARNRENQTLVVVAIHNDFPKVNHLKAVSQDDIKQIDEALIYIIEENFQKALSIFKEVHEKRRKILGPDNPGTLDVETHIARIFYKKGDYQMALNMFDKIFYKRKEILGLGDEDTLSSRSDIALTLHRQGKDKEALDIFEEVCNMQTDLLGANHPSTLNTKFHKALALYRLGKYDEALDINKHVFEKRKETLGVYNPATISAENNIAMVLANQGKYNEAVKVYKDAFEKKKLVLGPNHSDTLRTQHNTAMTLYTKKKSNYDLESHQGVLKVQKSVLGENHPDTLNSQYNMANVLFFQGSLVNALKIFKGIMDKMMVVFGPLNPQVLDIQKKIEVINYRLKFDDSSVSEILLHLQKDFIQAAANGDVQLLQNLLKDGADVNQKDNDGRTPLHYAVYNGQMNIVKILIKNGSDVTQVTNKGNTPLHTAVSKKFDNIIKILLQHVSKDKSSDFINAKTFSGGTTSLHVAANNGFLGVVKTLLSHGAIYNIENKKGKTPVNVTTDPKVKSFLELVEQFFCYAKKGNFEVITKLRLVNPNEFSAITNTRNNQGNTLLQVTIINKHKDITSQLLEMLKSIN